MHHPSRARRRRTPRDQSSPDGHRRPVPSELRLWMRGKIPRGPEVRYVVEFGAARPFRAYLHEHSPDYGSPFNRARGGRRRAYSPCRQRAGAPPHTSWRHPIERLRRPPVRIPPTAGPTRRLVIHRPRAVRSPFRAPRTTGAIRRCASGCTRNTPWPRAHRSFTSDSVGSEATWSSICAGATLVRDRFRRARITQAVTPAPIATSAAPAPSSSQLPPPHS